MQPLARFLYQKGAWRPTFLPSKTPPKPPAPVTFSQKCAFAASCENDPPKRRAPGTCVSKRHEFPSKVCGFLMKIRRVRKWSSQPRPRVSWTSAALMNGVQLTYSLHNPMTACTPVEAREAEFHREKPCKSKCDFSTPNLIYNFPDEPPTSYRLKLN